MRFTVFRLGLALAALLAGAGLTGIAHRQLTSPPAPRPLVRGAATSGGPQAECLPAPGEGAAIVVTSLGAVRGSSDGVVSAFKGIPYATPPVGRLRWRAPLPAPCWTNLRDATSFGKPCPQLRGGRMVGDEDCLTINVWTPIQPETAGSLPVMVFLHGGGNVEGSSAQQLTDGTYLYDGAVLAQKGNAVVVTLNYRLGIFGFLAHASLDAEPGQTTRANYGILDQIAALRWVQQNIPAFGGDPSSVLLFGESAGAKDTCILLASPMAAGLFSRALMESGPCTVPALANLEKNGDTLASQVGCGGVRDVPSCLRRIGAAELLGAVPVDWRANLNANMPAFYGPVVDGAVLKASPIDVLRSGQANQAPLIVGANSDETGMIAPPVETVADYASMMQRADPVNATSILARYPAAAYSTPRKAWVAVTTDAAFICPSRTIARVAAQGLHAPVYRYFFAHSLDVGPSRSIGAWHGLELGFVFGHLDVQGYHASAAEQALSDAIIGYWSRFAWTGDPNGEGAVSWPIYAPSSAPYLGLDNPIDAGQGIHSEACDFWDALWGVPA